LGGGRKQQQYILEDDKIGSSDVNEKKRETNPRSSKDEKMD